MNDNQSFTSQRNGFTSNSGNRNNDTSNTSYSSSSGRCNNHDGGSSQCSNPDCGHNSREIDRLQNEVYFLESKYNMEKSYNE